MSLIAVVGMSSFLGSHAEIKDVSQVIGDMRKIHPDLPLKVDAGEAEMLDDPSDDQPDHGRTSAKARAGA